MKRFFLIFLTFFLLSILVFSQQKTLPSNSQSQKFLIGTVDIQEAILKHPKAEESLNTLREFQAERQKDLDAKTKGKELTDEEKKQISELISKYEEEIENKDKELTAKLFEEIKLAIEKVAKRRGLILVVEKQSVFYGGIDITEEVIAELNKK